MNEIQSKHIVICGSMSAYDEMIICKEYLEKHSIPAIAPEKDNVIFEALSFEEKKIYKKNASKKHFTEVSNKNTYGILVVNIPKNSTKNYIGANSFAEIAVAFSLDKQIFLLNDYYDAYLDELVSWEVQALKGDLNILIGKFKEGS